MDIYLIWVTDTTPSEAWVHDAWDDYSIDNHPGGWEEARQKAYKQFGPEGVRVGKVKIDPARVEALWDVPEIEVTV